MSKSFFFFVTVLLLPSGCVQQGKAVLKNVPFMQRANRYTGKKYRPTNTVIPSFQPGQVPVSCEVFAHLLVWLPAGSNGYSVAQAVEKEAKKKGADMLLIGRSRQAESDDGFEFAYYGPEQPYNCREYWKGWKFGYDVWIDQGRWISIGYDEWGSQNIHFEIPVVLQTAFLRCLD